MIPSFRALFLTLALLRSVVEASRYGNYSHDDHKGHGDDDGHRDTPHYPGQTQEYDFGITWEDHAPDGYSRKMLLVNHQSPGPEIRVLQDEFIVVNVHNYSPYNATIHFHGMCNRN
jgi:FtsP/CotA-like multicopper oxidase with cupredoxin domain